MQFIPGAKIDFSSLREVRNKTKTFSLTRKIVFLYKKYFNARTHACAARSAESVQRSYLFR